MPTSAALSRALVPFLEACISHCGRSDELPSLDRALLGVGADISELGGLDAAFAWCRILIAGDDVDPVLLAKADRGLLSAVAQALRKTQPGPVSASFLGVLDELINEGFLHETRHRQAALAWGYGGCLAWELAVATVCTRKLHLLYPDWAPTVEEGQ